MEEFPYPHYVDYLKKLVDLLLNHKFRGGLLGIILTVTTASEDIATAEECTCSGNHYHCKYIVLPLLGDNYQETCRDKYRIDSVYILFY